MIRHHHIRVQLVVMKLGRALVKLLDKTSSDSRIFQPQGSGIGTVESRVSPPEFFARGNCASRSGLPAQPRRH
jgi:hypothetical protein